jgi:hypothetical protein
MEAAAIAVGAITPGRAAVIIQAETPTPEGGITPDRETELTD